MEFLFAGDLVDAGGAPFRECLFEIRHSPFPGQLPKVSLPFRLADVPCFGELDVLLQNDAERGQCDRNTAQKGVCHLWRNRLFDRPYW
ncbi:hypothetical protein [Chachezhania sediminis]|uniref:hypothetical protein n=1 Tax=Chachezhania sediminis TaxID=2599291 RepID=UPI00131A77AC|nr:hypothetical protein [Chachezhania sediminis]